MSRRTSAEIFDTQLDSWRAWQQTPWGRIRYRVVAETLRRTCLAVGAGPLRILDVGGGDGGDAVPLAARGHEVTILDFSVPLLARARAVAEHRGAADRLNTVRGDVAQLARLDLGTFDLVLCHNVIQYEPDNGGIIRALVGLVRARGALSMMAVNPASDLLTAAIRRADLREANEMLTATTTRTSTFGHDVRRVLPAEVEAVLAGLGFTAVTRYGIRVITDYITDEARKNEPEFYQQLEQLELELCDQEPYLHTARLWQLVASRSAS